MLGLYEEMGMEARKIKEAWQFVRSPVPWYIQYRIERINLLLKEQEMSEIKKTLSGK